MEVKVVQNILKANDSLARANRLQFDTAGLFAVNIIGSPGAGKTTVLEKLAPILSRKWRMACIEGDPYTTRDADRIARLGVPTVQINTRGGCHLEAGMVAQAVEDLDLKGLDLLLIENVGNLMCPSQYDLGEHLTMVVLSVTEGADKPEKYPTAFQRSRAVVINKIDVLAATDVDLPALQKSIRQFSPNAALFPLSARTGEGVETWAEWLEAQMIAHRGWQAGCV